MLMRRARAPKAAAADGDIAPKATQLRLLDAGIYVDSDGRIQFTPNKALECAASLFTAGRLLLRSAAMQDVTASGSSPRKMASRIHRHIESLAAVQIWSDVQEQQRRILPSAGGPEAGNGVLAVPTTRFDLWNNDQYEMATRMRLGAAALEAD